MSKNFFLQAFSKNIFNKKYKKKKKKKKKKSRKDVQNQKLFILTFA